MLAGCDGGTLVSIQWLVIEVLKPDFDTELDLRVFESAALQLLPRRKIVVTPS